MKRKMMSLALALVMSLSLCVPALAAESVERIEHLSTNSIITYIPSISPRANDPTHYTYIFTSVWSIFSKGKMLHASDNLIHILKLVLSEICFLTTIF
ncbi:hypothetical protein SDC9_67074 [bioreactor metagenome]|uniref:Uncharacterized protein n=1 Tax=bioreactor metagenome TaxID=1076179 RepID=A0A644XX17_9ZZZZ